MIKPFITFRSTNQLIYKNSTLTPNSVFKQKTAQNQMSFTESIQLRSSCMSVLFVSPPRKTNADILTISSLHVQQLMNQEELSSANWRTPVKRLNSKILKEAKCWLWIRWRTTSDPEDIPEIRTEELVKHNNPWRSCSTGSKDRQQLMEDNRFHTNVITSTGLLWYN